MFSVLPRYLLAFAKSCSPMTRRFAANFSEPLVSKETENVLVIHPNIRWGRFSRRKTTTAQLQLDEAVALCRTLPYFKVVGTIIVGTDYNTKSKMIWGKGRLEQLKAQKLDMNATAVMINASILSPWQQAALVTFFGAPVYDRYTVVLSIFKLYARTSEAHLQIALAELPYIRFRIKYLANNNKAATPNDLRVEEAAVMYCRGGSDALEMLRFREHALRKQIAAAVESKSAELEKSQARDKIHGGNVVVAVVGYTNAGKTSLIQRLTDSKIFGEDRLFATLDTTIHPAILPSKIRIILADTIGFISDLPISLFASFTATLKHVEHADLLVHIQDMSHPDVFAQRETVLETLRKLKIRQELLDTIISVGNKIDRIEKESKSAELEKSQEHFDEGLLNEKNGRMSYISCETGEGLAQLIKRIDLAVQKATKSKPRRFRLAAGSQAVPYLYENDLVSQEPEPSECGNYLVFDVIMNDSQLARFQTHTASKLKLKQKNAAEKRNVD